jgi:hypothetical protein
MARYKITTTDDQDAALAYSFEKAKPGSPPGFNPLPEDMTQEAYFQLQIDATVLTQMVAAYATALDTRLRASLDTIPPENQIAAAEQIATVIEDNGGEVQPILPGTPEPLVLVLRRRA